MRSFNSSQLDHCQFADFNGGAAVDYVLFDSSTRKMFIRYAKNGTHRSAGVFGPTLDNWREVVAVADMNRDNRPEFVLYNLGTG